jgi:hypothetical protein
MRYEYKRFNIIFIDVTNQREIPYILYDITEILLKVALSTITLILTLILTFYIQSNLPLRAIVYTYSKSLSIKSSFIYLIDE